MSEQPTSTTARDPTPATPWLSAAGWTFAVGIGLSACLLFTLEPMVGLQLLPILGGAPAVWATALAFFQLILLAGYLYAHVSVTRLGRLGPVVHLALAAAAGVTLVAAPRMADVHLASYHPVLQVLGTLAISVGLPAFLLCSTTPLLSAWLATALSSGAGADSGADPTPTSTLARDPYRLYVVSNAGSLLALLAYPIVVEPQLGLGAQRLVWGIFFALFVGVLAVVAVARLRLAPRPGRAIGETADGTSGGERIPTRRIARWLFLAAVPCGLLSAVTNFITADLIATPMLWVGPLGIYLATFIVAFSTRGGRLVRIATVMAPAMATLLWIPFGFPALWPTLTLLALELLGFGVVALALHGALVADRPSPSRLTMFYLVVSLGGVIGGSFVGFLAPVVFPGIWEYPILVTAAFLGMPSVRSAAKRLASGVAPQTAAVAAGAPAGRWSGFAAMVEGARLRLLPYAIVGVLFAVPAVIDRPISLILLVPLLLIGAFILLLGAQTRMMATATALVLVATVAVQPLAPIFSERDFFGVSQVTRNADATTLWHGTTSHGSQWTDPSRRFDPRGYYDRRGPMGDVMALADYLGPQEIGLAGLGSGEITAYERPVDHMTYFEIDPAVVSIASNPAYFTYLSQAPNRPKIITGDARLEIAKIPDASYDLLILDAFSGDSIPTHLLTVEALRDDLRVLRPGGLLLVHVSNRYYDLVPAVAAGCREVGLTTMSRLYTPTKAETDDGATGSEWVVAARTSDQLASLTTHGWTKPTPADKPITDDFPDVLRFARLGSWLTGNR
jgi:SAM-dependent methyltransferase